MGPPYMGSLEDSLIRRTWGHGTVITPVMVASESSTP